MARTIIIIVSLFIHLSITIHIFLNYWYNASTTSKKFLAYFNFIFKRNKGITFIMYILQILKFYLLFLILYVCTEEKICTDACGGFFCIEGLVHFKSVIEDIVVFIGIIFGS